MHRAFSIGYSPQLQRDLLGTARRYWLMIGAVFLPGLAAWFVPKHLASWFALGAGLAINVLVAFFLIRMLTDLDRCRRLGEVANQNEKRLEIQKKTLTRLMKSDALWRKGLPSAIREITEAAARVFAIERVGLLVFEERDRIRLADLYDSHSGQHRHETSDGRPVVMDYCATITDGRILLIDPIDADCWSRAFLADYLTPLLGLSAVLVAPVDVAGKRVGMMCYGNVSASRAWWPDEQMFAASLSDLVAALMEMETNRKLLIDIEQRKQSLVLAVQHEERLAAQKRVLTQLMKSDVLRQHGFDAAIREITEAAARVFDVEKAGFLMYEVDRARIRMVDSYDSRTGQHLEAMEGGGAADPVHCRIMAENRVTIMDAADAEAWNQSFLSDYLRLVLGTTTTALVAPVVMAGSQVGMLCFGNTSESRFWRPDEQMFAASLSDFITVLLEKRQRMQMARDLRDSEERFLVIASAVQNAVIMIDDRARVIHWSPAGKRILGYAPEEMLGQDLHRVIAPSRSYEQFQQGFQRFQETGQGPIVNRTIELRALTRDGREIPVEVSISATRYREQWHAVGILRDITDRKRAEEQLQFASFQSGVAAMSVSILHNIGNAIMGISHRAEKINEAGEELLTTGRILSRFGELVQKKLDRGRSPEQVLAELREVIEETGRDILALAEETLNKHGRRINEGIRHIGEIIQLQQDAARPDILATRFDLRWLLESAVAIQSDTLEKYGVDVEIDLDPAIGEITLPRNQLLQLVINLIKNAREAIQSRSVPVKGEIRIIARVVGDELSLRVVDNGCGIADDRLEDIFRYGFSTKDRGSGFGLHSAANFVQSVGGSIVAKSRGQNHGTEIAVVFPLDPPLEPSPESGVDDGGQAFHP